MYDHILVRYGELALKGKNKKEFIKTLVRNLRKQIKLKAGDLPTVEVEQGRLIIHLNGMAPEAVYDVLDHTFGLVSYSPVRSSELEEEAIIASALAEIKAWQEKGMTFRVSVKRANKQFPTRSMVMQTKIAKRILEELPDL